MNYVIDIENRCIEVTSRTRNVIKINEFDKLHYKFLPNTQDKFEIELVLLEVENEDGILETKAFGRRIDKPYWIMGLDLNDYNLEVIDNA